MLRIGKRREEYFAAALKLLCLKRNIGNLSAIQKKSRYLLRQGENERFVGYTEVIPKLRFWEV
jgi:hypothetical protein